MGGGYIGFHWTILQLFCMLEIFHNVRKNAYFVGFLGVDEVHVRSACHVISAQEIMVVINFRHKTTSNQSRACIREFEKGISYSSCLVQLPKTFLSLITAWLLGTSSIFCGLSFLVIPEWPWGGTRIKTRLIRYFFPGNYKRERR